MSFWFAFNYKTTQKINVYIINSSEPGLLYPYSSSFLMKNLCIYVQVRYASFRVKIRLLGHDKIKELASISSFARHP